MNRRAISRAACLATCLSLVGLLAAQQKACPWLWDAKTEQPTNPPPRQDGGSPHAPEPPSIGLAIQDAFAARSAASADSIPIGILSREWQRSIATGLVDPHAGSISPGADTAWRAWNEWLLRRAALAPCAASALTQARRDPAVGLTCFPNAPPA